MYQKDILILFFCLLIGGGLWAQERHLGLIMDERADAAYQRSFSIPNLSKGSQFAGNVPFKLSLKEYCPTPGDQGGMGTCVGYAVGYGALTIYEAVAKDITDKAEITRNAFSALFIYNYIKHSDCYLGAMISDAGELLEEKGNCRMREFNPTTCNEMPSAAIQSAARANQIENCLRVFDLGARYYEKIGLTQQMIAQGKPVIIGMQVTESFMNLRTTTWDPDQGDTANRGGHAMVVVGYNKVNKTFEIMNSWGTSWGDAGFFYMKEDDYARMCKYAYILDLRRNGHRKNEEAISLKGDFIFRYPEFGQGQEISFKEASVSFKGDHYELNRSDWRIGDVFQLVARGTEADEYVYVFSIDPINSATIHMPEDEALDPIRFDGAKRVPLMPFKGAEIVIPDEQSGLAITHRGTDHLIVLFANAPIRNFKQLVQDTRNARGTMYQRLESSIGSRLINPSEIRYSSNQMRFSATSSRGDIVPLILNVQAN